MTEKIMVEKNTRWHINKNVPVGIIITFLFQFGGFIWLFSGLSSDVVELQKSDIENAAVNKSFYALEATMYSMKDGQVRIETQLTRMDGRINRILEKD
ncbi:MAG: hypothetical protein COB36_11660 [Alphaproteobacteria bacterium]|nr:MAG: hypothetical protein COB36_11660 [Alphaproteobacteria bacterium]